MDSAARAIGIAGPLTVLSDGRIGYEGEKEASTGDWIAGASVNLPIPILDGGQAARFGAQSRYRQAVARHGALVSQVQSEVRIAALQLTAARKRADAYRTRIIPLRHRAVQETERLSNAMAVSVFMVLQARQAEIEAGLGYIEAVRDYWDARAQLERAAGGTLPSMMTGPAVPTPDSLPPIDLLRDARFVTPADTAPAAPGDSAHQGMRMAPGMQMAPGVKMTAPRGMSEAPRQKKGVPSRKGRTPAKTTPMAPGMKMPAGTTMDPNMKMAPPRKKPDPPTKMPGMKMPDTQ